jgi:hypothetical protein
MGNLTARNRFLGAALLGSLILHGIGAGLVPPFSHVPALAPVETISFTKIRRIEITHRASAAVRQLVARTSVAVKPRVVASPIPSRLKRDPNASPPPTQGASSQIAAIGQTAGKASQNATPQPGPPSPRATASADTRDVATTDRHVAGGYMPFGAAEPVPVLDPNARHRLEALNVHVTIVVVVGDNGRTKSVSFDPPLDKALEGQIQTLLASANWDPAYCGGGLPCEAAATIKL